MTNTATDDPLAVKPGETLQQHKTRVMQASQAHADAQKNAARATTQRPPEGFPKPPGAQPQIPDFMKEMGVQTPQEVQPTPAPSAPPAQGAPMPSAGTNEPEWQRVYREKGWRTPEDALKSYSDLEKEFHARNQRPPQAPPPPVYVPPQAPPQTWATPYPQYVPPPPQPQWQAQSIARQLGGKYQIPAEDADRLLPFVAEVSQAAVENALNFERARTQPVIAGLQREVERNREINEVANDPAMRVPRVQVEVNKILLENPSVFDFERAPLRWALDRALRNIAQESLRADENGRSTAGYPSQPPVTAGSGASTRGGQPPSGGPSLDLAGSYFKLKTAEEKKEVLRQMGVVPES